MQELPNPEELILEHSVESLPNNQKKSKKAYLQQLRVQLKQDLPMSEVEVPSLLDLCQCLPPTPSGLSTQLVRYYAQREMSEVGVTTFFVSLLAWSEWKELPQILLQLTKHSLLMECVALKGLPTDTLGTVLDVLHNQIALATRIVNPSSDMQHYQNNQILDWFECIIDNNYLTICLHDSLKQQCRLIGEVIQGYAQYVDAHSNLTKQRSNIKPPQEEKKRILKIIF